MTDNASERRGARRVNARLSLRINDPGAEEAQLSASIETINISSSGIYFRSVRFLEPMTKLALQLELPVVGPDEVEESANELVACEGLVVRTDPEIEDPDCKDYEVAVFFTHIEPNAISVLERHVAMLLQQGD
mgnify:FL=1